MIASDSLPRDAAVPRVPRPLAWLLLGGVAAAVLAVGVVTTAVVVADSRPRLAPLPATFWAAIAAGLAATCLSLGLRTLRWIFLLRRAGARIPIRDACIGYLAGFSLLVVPLLIGEAVVRAAIHKARARVPVATTVTVNLWERLLDITALAFIVAVVLGIMAGPQSALIPLTLVGVLATRSFRQFALAGASGIANAAVRPFGTRADLAWANDVAPLAHPVTWLTALAASIGAWILPGLAFWAIAASLQSGIDFVRAQLEYASSTLGAAVVLAPGGIRFVGRSLLEDLASAGVERGDAALAVLALRLVTAGLAIAIGAIFAWAHVRSRSAAVAPSHFDEIAHAYDAQIPAAQREALLARKTTLMRSAIERAGVGRRGLDVGCGQGWYVRRMRELGFEVDGIDASAAQVALARRNVDDPRAIAEGSALRIAAADASYDFVYCINVLHHLATAAEQRAAFEELLRVLKPGGLLFVHEINTRNVLFRFYMGYVFPSLNCIDEGTERWLLPHRFDLYTAAPVVATEYFTFMPEFAPRVALRLFRPIEALLESSPLRVWSAHYMAVLRKPAASQ